MVVCWKLARSWLEVNKPSYKKESRQALRTAVNITSVDLEMRVPGVPRKRAWSTAFCRYLVYIYLF